MQAPKIYIWQTGTDVDDRDELNRESVVQISSMASEAVAR